MAAVTPYAKGLNLTSVVVTPQTKASDGTFTAGTSKTITTLMAEQDFQSTPEKEDIGPVTTSQANMEIVTNNSSLMLRVLILASGENPLATLFASYDYFRAQWTRGGQSYDYYCSRGNFGDTINSRAGNYQVGNFDQINIGSTNPIYA